MLSPIDDRVFRANPNYELVLLDRLPVEERDRLVSLRRDSDLYGVLRPRGDEAGRRTIAASREVALLIFTLQQAGPLPSYVRDTADPQVRTVITQLVLDGVLDIQAGGEFVSGAAALADLQPATAEGAGRIAALSRDAVSYAAQLDATDPVALEVRLYLYNRRPVTPAWTERVSGSAALRRFVGFDSGPTSALLDDHWRTRAPAKGEGWIHWASRDRDSEYMSRDGVLYKLYVSPQLESLPDVFPTIARVLTESGAGAFKIGATLHGLTRADKLVAYFDARDDALECGETLVRELSGIATQAVPFTAEIGGDGLVSWGVDPPAAKGGDETESWRGWICRRLAHYLFAARQSPDDRVSPDRFALQRLELDGIDTANWIPDVTRFEHPRSARADA